MAERKLNPTDPNDIKKFKKKSLGIFEGVFDDEQDEVLSSVDPKKSKILDGNGAGKAGEVNLSEEKKENDINEDLEEEAAERELNVESNSYRKNKRTKGEGKLSDERKEMIVYLRSLMSGANFNKDIDKRTIEKIVDDLLKRAKQLLGDNKEENEKEKVIEFLKKDISEKIARFKNQGSKRCKIFMAIQDRLGGGNIEEKRVLVGNKKEKKNSELKLENFNEKERSIFESLKKDFLDLYFDAMDSGRFKDFDDAREYLKNELTNLTSSRDALTREYSFGFIQDMEDLVLAESEKEIPNIKRRKPEDEKKKEDNKLSLENLAEDEAKIFESLKKDGLDLCVAIIKSGRFKNFEDAREYLKVEIINLAEGYDVLTKERSWDFIQKMADLVLAEVAKEVADMEIEKPKNKNEDEDKNEKDEKEALEKIKDAESIEEILMFVARAGGFESDGKHFSYDDISDLIYQYEKEGGLKTILPDEYGFRERVTFLLSDKMKEKENNAILKNLGDQLQEARKEYLQKEDEVGIKISRLKNFFKNFISIGDNYQVEKELEEYKQRYEAALKNYTDAIVDIEGVNDADEREIMYRYVRTSEKLEFLSEKETVKYEKHPYFKYYVDLIQYSVGSSFLDEYRKMMADIKNKSQEWITKNSGSKILGFGSGKIVIGGLLSFAGNISTLGVLKYIGIAAMAKGFYEKGKQKEIEEKNEELNADLGKLERLYNLNEEVSAETLKRELQIGGKDIPETVMKDVERYYRRIALSLGGAVASNILFSKASQWVKESGIIGNSIEAIKKLINFEDANIPVAFTSTETGVQTNSVASVTGNQAHQGPTMPSQGTSTPTEPVLQPEKIIPENGGTGDGGAGDQPVETGAKEIPSSGAGAEALQSVPENIESAAQLDPSGESVVEVIRGGGIKDSLAKFLEDHHQELTEGKMGWDPDKYESVEDWANRRAIGIVGELKRDYPNYNFDKVSEESSFQIKFSDKADIKIKGFNDPLHLGGSAQDISGLENEMREVPAESVNSEKPEEVIVEKVSSIDNSEKFNLDESLAQIKNELGGDVNPSSIFENDNSAGEIFSEPISNIVGRLESFDNYVRSLPEIIGEDSKLGSIFEAFYKNSNEAIASQPKGGVFDQFRIAVEKTVGKIPSDENMTVRKYVMTALATAFKQNNIYALEDAMQKIVV